MSTISIIIWGRIIFKEWTAQPNKQYRHNHPISGKWHLGPIGVQVVAQECFRCHVAGLSILLVHSYPSRPGLYSFINIALHLQCICHRETAR